MSIEFQINNLNSELSNSGEKIPATCPLLGKGKPFQVDETV